MPAQRLAMRQVYEVLRLKWDQGLSERKSAQSLGISRPAVAEYVRRAQAAGMSWPLPATCDAGALEQLLFPSVPARAPAMHPVPDWATVHRELKHRGVTLFLLWKDDKAATPEGLQYSWFCQTYRAWANKRDLVMRQTHRAGEKLFVDDAGQSLPVVNRHSGEVTRRSFLLRSWGPPATPTPKPPGPRVCPTGSARTCGPLRRSAGSPRSSSPITSKRP
jgi:hypothetical protein